MTGGQNGNDYLASTEVLTATGDSWITAGSLPSPLTGLRGLNLNNKIFMTGSGTDYSTLTVGPLKKSFFFFRRV